MRRVGVPRTIPRGPWVAAMGHVGRPLGNTKLPAPRQYSGPFSPPLTGFFFPRDDFVSIEVKMFLFTISETCEQIRMGIADVSVKPFVQVWCQCLNILRH